jgi:hypothetical protein
MATSSRARPLTRRRDIVDLAGLTALVVLIALMLIAPTPTV